MKNKFLQAVFRYVLFGFIILILISITKNIGKVFAIRAEVAKQKAKVAKIEAENLRIQMEISKAQSPEFIERQVRDKLGLVKEGETVVVLPEIEEVKKLAPKLDLEEDYLPDPNWRKWLKLFL